MKVQIPKDKYFNVKTKEELVDIMREPMVSACNLALDKLINQKDILETKKDLSETEQETFKNYSNSIKTYEDLKDKLLQKKELNDIDFNLCALLCGTVSSIFDEQIDLLKSSAEELRKIGWKIIHLKSKN